jgi:hypothetical protein
MCDMVSLSDKISARFLVPRTLRNVVAARSLVEWLQTWKDAVGEVEVLSLVATYIYTYKYIPINIACRELKAQQKRGKKMARKEREWKKKNVQCYNMRMHANVLTALAMTLRKTHMYCWLYVPLHIHALQDTAFRWPGNKSKLSLPQRYFLFCDMKSAWWRRRTGVSGSMLLRDSRGAIKSYSVQYWENFGDKRDLCTLHRTK